MLNVEKIVTGYGARKILDDIDFSIAQGEFVGILGPNGSGKTTLLRTLTRILAPWQGRISLDGKDIRQIAPKEFARKFAMVSQTVSPVSMTVEEFVLIGRTPHYRDLQFLETAHDLEIAEQSMRLTGVLELRHRLIDRISGGERQIAAIARALAQEPSWLVLDEPTTHLDIAHQIKIMDLLLKLNRDFGKTIIMVLHDLNLAAEYCRRLVLMGGGRIRKMGDAFEVLDKLVLEEVYGTSVVTGINSVTSKPFVLPLPSKQIGTVPDDCD